MSDCNETKEELEIRRAASLEVLGISAPMPPNDVLNCPTAQIYRQSISTQTRDVRDTYIELLEQAIPAAPIPPTDKPYCHIHPDYIDEKCASCQRKQAAPIPPTPSQQESVPKGFIVVSKDLLAEAIACNTDASLAEARHIINSVLKVSDDEIFRETLREQTK